MSQRKIIGAVEIGTSKIVVLVGEVYGRNSMNIIGVSQTESMGVSKGDITNLKMASDCVHEAIQSAEKRAKVSIDSVFISCGGHHLEGFPTTGRISVSSPDNVIGKEDIQRVAEIAKGKSLGVGRVYLHHILGGYSVDGEHSNAPLGMFGKELEVKYWNVSGEESKISNSLHIINGFGIKVDDMIISSIASGGIVASDEERKRGVLVLDIGAGTTDYSIYKNGVILKTGSIAIGGDHITNDLSLGLHISFNNAESLKQRVGKAIIDPMDRNDSVFLFGNLQIGDAPVSKNAIYKIINARIEELMRILQNQIGAVLSEEILPAGVVLTGGTSRLPYICESVRTHLKLGARLGQNPSWVTDSELREPEYSTVIGLLQYALSSRRPSKSPKSKKGTGWIRKVTHLFTTN
jgi:cell division protein FtsA